MKDQAIISALELLDPPKGFQNWHGGPTLMGCLRGVDAEQAGWKPAPDRHSIWELALHKAYWNYRVRLKLDSNAEKGFGRSPANWPLVEDLSQDRWKIDKRFIKEEHDKLVESVRNFTEERVNEQISDKNKQTYRHLIVGIATHDTYHIAQIQLMKRLYREMG